MTDFNLHRQLRIPIFNFDAFMREALGDGPTGGNLDNEIWSCGWKMIHN